MAVLDADDPRAVAVTAAIRSGDVPALRKLLAAHPGLAASWIRREGKAAGTRSLLHIATDWPGHLPAGPEVIGVLVAAGADPGARFVGTHRETPLHWAASNDDVAAIDALLAAGADIEAVGAVVGGRHPAGRRARVRPVAGGPAAAGARGADDPAGRGGAGAARPRPGPRDGAAAASRRRPRRAFWDACHGGQRATARLLLERGASLDRVGYDGMTPLDIAVAVAADDVVAWLRGQGARTGAGAEP